MKTQADEFRLFLQRVQDLWIKRKIPSRGMLLAFLEEKGIPNPVSDLEKRGAQITHVPGGTIITFSDKSVYDSREEQRPIRQASPGDKSPCKPE